LQFLNDLLVLEALLIFNLLCFSNSIEGDEGGAMAMKNYELDLLAIRWAKNKAIYMVIASSKYL